MGYPVIDKIILFLFYCINIKRHTIEKLIRSLKGDKEVEQLKGMV